MEEDKKEKEGQILELKNEVKTLNGKVETMDRNLDCHEQYVRRNFLFLLGVKENDNENTYEVITEIILITDRSHRPEEKHTGSRPWHIIFKFARYNVRNAIFRNKKI